MIGCGVVVDPGSLIEEMESLVQRGVTLDGNLFISKNAHLIMPYHPALDRASEAKLGSRRIGTTGKGVGPAYVDKAARVGIRMADLLDERLFREKLEINLAQKNRLLREIYDARDASTSRRSSTRICATPAGWRRTSPTRRCCCTAGSRAATPCCSRAPRRTMLDIDHGTYPVHHLVIDDGRRRLHRHRRAADEDPRRRSAWPRPTRRASAADRSRPR